MLDRFVRLCEMPSPTGSERAVADDVLAELRELGVEVAEDGAAGPARAGAGQPDRPRPGRARRVGDVRRPSRHRARMTGAIEVGPGPGRLSQSAARRSSGPTTRRRSTVLVELAARHARTPGRRWGSSWCSRWPRRTGCAVPRSSTSARFARRFGFVLDHASPIGEVITAAPTYKRLAAEFEGIEAHSGIRPEDGRSAIAAAAAAISRDGAGPPRRGDDGQRRRDRAAGPPRTSWPATAASTARRGASTTSGPATAIGAMVDACTWAASEHECDVDVEVTEMFRGYRLPSSSPVGDDRARRARALRRRAARGRDRRRQRRQRVQSRRGFECVLLANGTEANHTPEESVAADRIVQMLARLRGDAIEEAARSMLKLRRGVVVGDRPADGARSTASAARRGPTRRWSARSRSATR